MKAGRTTARLLIPTDGESPFGCFHRPEATARKDLAVMICPPFGWEDFCSYRSRRSWAEHLAVAGYPALRIDLPASGDSAGSPRDAARLDAWSEGVRESADWLRETTGAGRVAAIGIGLGGFVAVHAIAAGAAIDDLVLWAVPSRGRTLLRELRAFAMLNAEVDPADAGAMEQPPAASPAPPADGALEVGGFLLRAETVGALEGADLAALEVPEGTGLRVLMLERDGIKVDRRLRRHLEDSGIPVDVGPGQGYTAMMAHPQEARPPLAEFEAVNSWLAVSAGSTVPPEPEHPPSECRVELDVGGSGITETSFVVEQSFGELPGILSLPGADVPTTGLCAVLLNAGALRRIGPGRMWVDVARSWAARGVPTLRIDLEGIGDADGDAGPYEDTAALYVPKLIDQTIGILDALEEHGLPPRFVLVGLCSSAYWSFHAALRDERVSAAFLVNPRALFWDGWIEEVRNARRLSKALRADSWRRLTTGGAPVAKARAIGRAAVLATTRSRAIAASQRSRGEELDEAIERLEESGTRILLAFGGREPLFDELEAEGRLGAFANSSCVEVVRLPGSDHTLRPIRLQEHARSVLDGALEVELQQQ